MGQALNIGTCTGSLDPYVEPCLNPPLHVLIRFYINEALWLPRGGERGKIARYVRSLQFWGSEMVSVCSR